MTWTMEWINQQVELYQKQERAHYEAYAELLKSLLKRACEMHAPMAQVQSRAKMPASFAEKCIRKYPQYEEPVFELTDLCGARVITHSQIEADMICHFIRSQFTIDEDGKVIKVKTVRSVNNDCDKEAERLIKTMPNWVPGKQRGKPVRVQFTMGINFTLE